MLNILEKINNDLKAAMREKRSEDLSTLRMALSSLKNKKIELGNQNELSDEEAQAVIKSEVKKRKDSIEAYRQGGREDLALKEQREIDFLSQYLPEQMSEEQVEAVVLETIDAMDDKSMSNFGLVMSQVMQKTKGKADGQMVSAVVKRKLAK